MVATGVREAFLLLLLTLLIPIATAEIISLDPCGETQTYEQGQGGNAEWVLENNCMKLEMRQLTYDPTTQVYDKINDRYFSLMANRITEINNQDPLLNWTQTLTSFQMTSDIDEGYIRWSNNDYMFGYTITGNSIKVVADINNYSYNWSDSTLWLEYKIHKNPDDNLLWLPVIVDDIEIPIEIINKTVGQNTFISQNIGHGQRIIIDPIYLVDYSPLPGQWLITGDTTTDHDNSFDSISDITTGVSDSSDGTNYNTYRDTINSQSIDYTDQTFETASYFSTNNHIVAVDFNLGTDKLEQMQVCYVASENALADARLSIGTTIYATYPLTLQTGSNPTTTTCISVDPSLFSTGTNRIGMGCYSNCGGTKRVYTANDISQPNSTSYYWDTSSWGLLPTMDVAIWINYNTSTTNEGKAITGHWNQTYEDSHQYFLRIKKVSSGTQNVTVIAYYNTTHINPLYNQTKELSGIGWFNINITEIIDYETNTALMNYTQIRFMSWLDQSFAEVLLRKELNDTNPPTINSYSINDTTISCLQTSRLTANITDDIDVDEVNFTINNLTFETTKNGDLFYYDLSPTENGTTIYEWTNITACDILGNCLNQNISLSINYTCSYEDYINITHVGIDGVDQTVYNDSAWINWTTSNPSDSRVDYGANNPNNLTLAFWNITDTTNHFIPLLNLLVNTTYYYNITSSTNPNQTIGVFNFTTLTGCIWEAYYINITSCEINNTYQRQLLYNETSGCGTLDGLPIDNGTITEEYCNYCDPDWFELTGGIHDCQENSTRYAEYVDLNSCYSVTNLTEDEPPIDHETWVSCIFYVSDFNCTLSAEPYLKKKMEYTCYLPVGTGEYSCVNTVSYGFDDILQVNPQRQERSDSLIGTNLVETREFFTTSNGILNAYYTNKNIIAGNPFTIVTTCNNNSTSLVHQIGVTPVLQDLDQLAPIMIWTRNNVGYLTAGFLLILVIVGILAFWFKEWRTNK